MDDPAVYTAFITNVAGVTTPRVRVELLDFANTFETLLSCSEDELDAFVKDTHTSNSARAANSRILIPTRAIIAIKAILFELKERDKCDALPSRAALQGIDIAQIGILRSQRNQALEEDAQLDKESSSSSMTIPKLTATNYDEFITAFTALASRTMSSCGATLDYLMRENDGNYDAVWVSRAERLKNCAKHNGPCYRKDRETLYTLFIEHIGTTGLGSDVVNRYKRSKDGRSCYRDLNNHFKNESYLNNIATTANAAMSRAVYRGDKQHFTLETYYSIMSKAFNDLALAGPAYALSEHQKVTKFEAGLKDKTAINYSVIALNEWNNLPAANQTFDTFYNEFSKYMTKFKTMAEEPSRTSRIASLTAGGRGGRTGRGRSGRGGRGGRGFGRGRGRGRYCSGRHRQGYQGYQPYSLARNFGNFTPEARIYTSDEWAQLTHQQRQMVQELKIQEGWTNGQTPPVGCVIDQHGYATASTTLVAAVQRSISAANTSLPPAQPRSVPMPPPPARTIAQVPPVINTQASQAGASFGRSGTRQGPNHASSESVSQVSMTSINGQPYPGPVYDANRNRIA